MDNNKNVISGENCGSILNDVVASVMDHATSLKDITF